MHNLQWGLQEFPGVDRLERPVAALLASPLQGIIQATWMFPAENQPRVLRRRATDVWDFLGASVFAWIGLCVALLFLAGVVYWLRSWWREDSGREADSNELLTQFRELHREGDLTDEEFRSIKSRLATEVSPPSSPSNEGDDKSD